MQFELNCSKLEYDDSQLTTSLVTICQSVGLVNLIMQSNLLVRPDPEGYQLELQSNKPIIRYCWLVRMDRGDKVWKCKLCNKEFTGSKIVVATLWSNKKSADEVLAKKARVAVSFLTVANCPASVSALLTAQSRPNEVLLSKRGFSLKSILPREFSPTSS